MIAGFFSGFLGIGGATVMVPALTLLLKIDQKKAQGTSLLVITILALISSIQYYRAGNFNITYAIWLAAGSMLGILIGAELMHKIHSQILTKIFGVFALLVALKMFLG